MQAGLGLIHYKTGKKMKLQDLEKKTRKKGVEKSHPYAILFRKAALVFTRLIINTRITPNTISWLNILLVFIAGFFFFLNKPLFLIIGILILYLINILDKVDGQLARYKKMFTDKGIFLDEQLHNILRPVIFIFLGVGFFIFQNSIYPLIAGFFIAIFSSLTTNSYLQRLLVLKSSIKNKYPRVQIGKRVQGKSFSLFWIIKKLFQYINLFNKEILLIFVLVGKVPLILYFYALFYGVNWLIYFFIFSMFREKKLKEK